MTTLHLFNPENDLALATNEPHYTPRARATLLARAGGLLPAWMAAQGDCYYVPTASQTDVDFMQKRFGIECKIFSETDVIEAVEPWGWSLYARNVFRNVGVDTKLLPDDATLAQYRQLSSRATAYKINQYIKETVDGQLLPPDAIVTDVADEAIAYIARVNGNAYVKAPWSSSGRGVFPAATMPVATLGKQIEGIIKRQGFVTIETALNKRLDFAALFESRDGMARFIGWSVFDTFDRCAYNGNIVAPQAYLQTYIESRLSDESHLSIILEKLTGAVNQLIAPLYEGRFGVDMMIYRAADGRCLIAPCIEVNLRKTMGMVALGIAERLDISHPAMFRVEYKESFNNNDAFDILPPSDSFRFTLANIEN
ncbi:MAG: hypothetical protein J1E63_09025 [Muribaculaceae bacterium]|nr:hypothetical protein [Muribaculaceae bacterium]